MKKEVLKNKLKIYLEFAIIFVVIVIVLWIIFGFSQKNPITSCGDETSFVECSLNKPYFCEEGILTEKASVCGCPSILVKKEDFCYSPYQQSPKNASLRYILDSKEKKIDFMIYKGVSDYLKNLKTIIFYNHGQIPQLSDFKIRHINESLQREMILPLVIKIQNLAPGDKVKQARIAISLVQNINYGYSNKTTLFAGNQINYSRYPYDVLYDSEGICGEKSELLVFLLKEIGFGTAIIFYADENHEAVGIECPIEESLNNSGYCYIETTAPAIITDDKVEFLGGKKLESEPLIIPISEGISLPEDLQEYEDAENLENLKKELSEKNWVWPFKKAEFENLKEKYELGEGYYLS